MARIAVLAESERDATALAALLRDLGHKAAPAVEVAFAAAAIRDEPPSAALLSSQARSPQLRSLASRVREAAEAPLPLVFALPDSAWWLHAPPGAGLAPVAVVRRSGLTAPALGAALLRLRVPTEASARSAAVTLDVTRRRLEGPAGLVRLTPAEGALAELLIASAGQVLSLDVLCDAVWGAASHDAARTSALRTHLHNLRAKLEQAGAGGALVTESGRGYRFAPE